MKYGFCVEWYTRKNGKKHVFISESITETERKQRELKAKHYKVSEIMQCIF